MSFAFDRGTQRRRIDGVPRAGGSTKRVNQLYDRRPARAELCWEKGVDVSVAGVPKTIDNDIGADAVNYTGVTQRLRSDEVVRGILSHFVDVSVVGRVRESTIAANDRAQASSTAPSAS